MDDIKHSFKNSPAGCNSMIFSILSARVDIEVSGFIIILQSRINPVKALSISFQYRDSSGPKQSEKEGVSYGMEAIKPYTIEQGYKKSPEGERINESCPEPDIHYQTVDVSTGNAKDDKPFSVQVELPEIGGGYSHYPPCEHLIRCPWSVAEEEVGNQCCHCPHHESSYRPEDISRADYKIGGGLYIGQGSERDSHDCGYGP